MIRYLLGISLLMLTACQKNETDPQLKRAFEIHEMALAVHDSLKTQLEALSTQTLTPEQQQTVAQIERSRNEWAENLVEVPGFAHDDHDHDHGHDHDHDHDHSDDKLMENLPPAEVLQIQQAMANEVKGLLDATRRVVGATIDQP